MTPKPLIPLLALMLAGCALFERDPNAPERGPHGTRAYQINVETTPAGARIEVNGDFIGLSPLDIKVFASDDRHFHDQLDYTISAYPTGPGEFKQEQRFSGKKGTYQKRDPVPKRLYFDLRLDSVRARQRLDIDFKP